jgi:hypothetical protein
VASLLFRDKVYWRRAQSPLCGPAFHAFINVTPYAMRGSWESLCGKYTISGPGGKGRGSNQKINRPVEVLRCKECDAAEAKRRMRSMPASRKARP